MDSALKQRLIGAAVLVALAMIFLPMLLQGPDVREPDAAQVPLSMPDAPDQEFETRELPLAAPEPPGEGEAVLGVPAAPDDPNAVATVEAGTEAAPRVDFTEPTEPADDGAPLQAVDAATGQPQPAAPAVAPTEPAPAAPAPTPTPAAPAPTPAPAAPLPATAAGGRYAVNVGSFSNQANARTLADKLRAQGLPVTSESVDVNGKPAMRLRVGPYAERALAEAARLRAESVTGGGAAVIALDAAAPAASAPAPATRAPAAASVGFAVQLGALSNEADATALRDRARAAGFTAFHQRIATERGVVWRVRVGPEADRAAAERLRDGVAAKLGLRDAIIVPHP
ncbi:SPOR domain-containing protein [Arenimonas sp.]|uniref:SPOR domain-containing protein n=1 Tax=Arenimonas sp. TaxID=1872635 RepID=UPI0035AF18B7